MKITSAAFLVSAVAPEQYPRQPLPEVAFAGRSNVGKSSLINALVHRKNLVKTSATPGKTRAINFFLVNRHFVLVDLPGYGYARVPRQVRANWQPMVETYLRRRNTLRAIVHIVDLRHPPTEQDLQLRDWLHLHGILMLTVATKADKVKAGQRARHIADVRRGLALPIDAPLLVFSARTHEGRLQLWQQLVPVLTLAPRQRQPSGRLDS